MSSSTPPMLAHENETLNLEYFTRETAKNTIDDWRYEMRREIQEVLPWVFLGPFSACKNTQRLHELGITHILCFMDQYELRLLRTDALAREFRLRVIEISDCNMQNLIPYFPEANACINAAREEGGKILVCCIGGLSRSPSFVIAYTMEMFNLRASQAYQYVQSKRLCITPNEGFKSQLNEYEPIYMARKNVQSIPTSSEQHQQQRRRPRSGMDDDDENMDDVENEAKRRLQDGGGSTANVFGPGISGMIL